MELSNEIWGVVMLALFFIGAVLILFIAREISMKKLGYMFFSIFFAIGIATNTNLVPTMQWLIAVAFVFFLLGMYFLMKSE